MAEQQEALVGSDWKRTAPLGILARLATNLRQAILPLVALAIGSGGFDEGPALAPVVAVALVGGILFFSWLAWSHHRYQVGSDDIRVERGLLSRQTRAVPFDRIQDVSLQEPPVPRLLGLVEVRFETGAGGKDEVRLAYVTRAEAEALRSTVRARREGQAEADAADGAAPIGAEPPARLLYGLTPRRLMVFGLFEFSLVVFAVLFGALDQLEPLLPFEPWDFRQWLELVSGPGHWLAELGLAAQVAGAAIALGTLAGVGLVTGIVRTVLRDYGFRLELTGRGLRRRRGLLTRSDVVMPVHRVQALTVTTGIVRRHFGPPGGWHGLEVVSLGQDEKNASHTVAPFAALSEIDRIVSVTGFALPGPGTVWQRTSAAMHRNRALIVAAPLLALALAALLGAPVALAGSGSAISPRWFALPLVALAGLATMRRWYLWRHDRWALDAERIFVRRGWLSPRLDVASRVRVQSVELVQGPLGRRGGYADLELGIAGGQLAIHGLHESDARVLRDAILDSVAEMDFSRLGTSAPAHAHDAPGAVLPHGPADADLVNAPAAVRRT